MFCLPKKWLFFPERCHVCWSTGVCAGGCSEMVLNLALFPFVDSVSMFLSLLLGPFFWDVFREEKKNQAIERLALFLLLLSLAQSSSKGFPFPAADLLSWRFSSVSGCSFHPPLFLLTWFLFPLNVHFVSLLSPAIALPFHLSTSISSAGSCPFGSLTLSTKAGKSLHLARAVGLSLFVFHSTLPF